MRNMTGDTDVAPPQYASRWAERDARRKANAALAAEAAHRRASRNKTTLVERVERAKQVLAGKNTAGAIQTIAGVSSQDRDIYVIAEKYGQARRDVLKHIGPARASVETAYLAEVGSGSPDQSLDEGE